MLGPFFVEKTAARLAKKEAENAAKVLKTLDVWDLTFTGWWLMMVNDG